MGGSVVVDEVAAPADPGDERVRHAERRGNGDGRIGSAPTSLEHAQARGRRDRAVSGHRASATEGDMLLGSGGRGSDRSGNQ
jgi:hypothetical protein